jgi:PII-like signaling protein
MAASQWKLPMQTSHPAKLLRLHFSENDKYQGKPLYEAVVQKCRDLSIAGATVFRGLEGYGESAEIHRHHLVVHDQPIVVTIIDSEENIQRLVPVLEEMLDTGLIAISNVQAVRIRK